MKSAHYRYVRQIQVLGAALQDAFAAGASAVRGDDLAATVTALYLAGSGVGRLRVTSPRLAALISALNPSVSVSCDSPSPRDSADERAGGALPELGHPSAAAVAAGAVEALHALAALAGESARGA